MILDFSDFVGESKIAKKDGFEEFAQNRMNGAQKISSAAKEKGGDAMLTYHHFVVKLPYYKEAAEGKMDFKEVEKQVRQKIQQLKSSFPAGGRNISQVDFQKLMGEIEVLGELLIKHK